MTSEYGIDQSRFGFLLGVKAPAGHGPTNKRVVAPSKVLRLAWNQNECHETVDRRPIRPVRSQLCLAGELKPVYPAFMSKKINPLVALGVAGLAALLPGCASSGVKNPSGVGVTEMKADERGFVAGTGVESQDLVAVTDKMARGILGVPSIASATTPPRIVLDPVQNETRFPIN